MKWLTTASLSLLVAAPAASAFTVGPGANPKSSFLLAVQQVDSPPTATATESSVFDKFESSLEEEDFPEEEPWQAKLETLLDPATPLAKRQVLLSELLAANQEIRDTVQEALRERNIDPLLTPNAKRLQEGTKAVARQLTNDIFPNVLESISQQPQAPPPPPDFLPKIGSRVLSALGNQAKKTLQDIQGDLKDPSRIPQRITQQTEDLAKELQNVFAETPEGLEGPPYTVVENCGDYEVRDYAGYTVASTNMDSTVNHENVLQEVASEGAAFNALAAYLFGANEDKSSMAMTTPVTTTSSGEMRFYLTKTNPPEPMADDSSIYETGAVQIVDIPPARLAVRRFAGFATEGEINRQKEVLLEQVTLDDKYEIDVPHGAVVPHVVFQYNPPYTVPIVRRNEIAVPLERDADVGAPSLESQWQASNGGAAPRTSSSNGVPDTHQGQDDIAPSDVAQ